VGWDDVMQDGEKRYELLDISAVAVPGDAAALIERHRRGWDSVRQALDSVLDESEEGPEWRDVASEMADIFAPDPEDTDDERHKRYNALLPHYRRLGKEPPEFMARADLVALTPDLVRGLFLEGEAEFYRAPLEAVTKADLEALKAEVMELLKAAEPAPEPDPLEEAYNAIMEENDDGTTE